MSLVHGCPGFGCLSPCIVEGPNKVLVSVNDVYDMEIRSSLETLLMSPDEANAMIDSSPLSTLLDLAGTFKSVSSLDEISTLVQQTVKWLLLEMVTLFTRAICKRAVYVRNLLFYFKES